MSTGELRLVDEIASFGLAGAAGVLIAEPLDEDAWSELLDGVARNRLVGHLVHAVDRGALATTTRQRDEAIRALEHEFAIVLAIEATLIETAARLDDAGISIRVLKGPALARLAYPDVSLRVFGDLDILIRGDEYDHAISVLRSAGARRRYPEPRPGFDRRFGKGVCMVQADELEIDVHRTFVAGPFGLAIDPDDLWRRSECFNIAGREFAALDRECRFLHACYHVALGDEVPRRPALRDVAQILEHDAPDTDRTLELCDRWRATAVASRAVALTVDLLGWASAHPLVDALRGYEPTRFEQRALRSYSVDASYAARAATGVLALDRPADRVAYTWSLLVPSRHYLLQRDGTYLRRARRALRLARTGWDTLR